MICRRQRQNLSSIFSGGVLPLKITFRRYLMRALITVLLFSFSVLFSDNYYVETTGTDNASCSVSNPCEHIQTAINLTSNGDMVIVSGGTYLENLLIETGITLKSADQNNPAIIDGSSPETDPALWNGGSCIVIRTPRGASSRVTATVEDVHLTGGKGTVIIEDTNHDGDFDDPEDEIKIVGGGMIIHNAGLLSRGNKIMNNGDSSTKEGGAVYAAGTGADIPDDNPADPPDDHFPNERSVIVFEETIFSGNDAQTGHTVMVNGWDPDTSQFLNMDFGNSHFDCIFDSDNNELDGVSEYWVKGKDNTSFDFTGGISSEIPAITTDVWVDPVNGMDEGNTSGSIEQPFKTIEYAMSMVYSIDPNNPVIIYVVGTINSDTESFPIIISSSVTIHGFEGNATLDARGNSSVLLIVNVDYSTVIRNLTITGGNNTDSPGGGIVFFNSNPTLTHVTISGNTTDGYGGGMYLYDSDPTFTDVTISENSAGMSGGGVYSNFSEPIFENVIIEYNSTVQGHGGGIYLINSSNSTLSNVYITYNTANGVNSEVHGGGIAMDNSYPILSDVTLSYNSAVSSSYAKGGGIYCGNSYPILNRVLLHNNLAKHGGGLSLVNSDPLISNATISGNTAINSGGGIHIASNASLFLINSIIWDNGSAGEIAGFGESTVTYSDVQVEGDAWFGGGNINADPQFVDTQNGNYSLQEGSPCIDAGTADLDGDGYEDITDYYGQAPDMGAFEWYPEEPEYELGDLNDDGLLNILDVVILVNIVLGYGDPLPSGDLNGDGVLNVLDVVVLVNIILGG